MDWREARIGGHVNPGWVPLVDGLHAEILKLAPNIIVDQVKEKFGRLRYYWSLPSGEFEREIDGISGVYVLLRPDQMTVGHAIEALVGSAEAASGWICEVCGAAGARPSSGTHGWLNTLCAAHTSEREETGDPAWLIAERFTGAPR